jgi:hypothetical protein
VPTLWASPAPAIADHARRIAKSPFVGGKWIDPDMRLDSWRAQQRGGHVFLLRPDGSATELAPGTNGHATVPGDGVIVMWAGAARGNHRARRHDQGVRARLHHAQLQQPVRAPRRLIVAQLESRASA